MTVCILVPGFWDAFVIFYKMRRTHRCYGLNFKTGTKNSVLGANIQKWDSTTRATMNDLFHLTKVTSHLQNGRPILIVFQVDTHEIDNLTSTVGKFHRVVSFCMNNVECC